jgi:alkanesulfonate monooxygenase SsuD/methylene tetrahydromethanopterin reductase-like flavin-dependent oxidoreductase (luciferase family)
MSRMEIGICLLPTRPVEEVVGWARLCEDVGLDFVGVADVQTLWPDLYMVLTAVAAGTTRIKLGPWVTNPVTRHITVTANCIATLDAISGGRAFLGIGNGDGAVRTIGTKPARFEELARAVGQIHDLSRGKPVDGLNGAWTLATARGDVTVYWAAADERSLVEGGRVADGVIVSGWLLPELLDRARHHIGEGARAAGRDPGVVEPIFNTGLSIDDDRARALNAGKPYLARALARKSSLWLPDWTEADMQAFRSRYDYHRHFRADHELSTLVPDHMVQRKAVAGTPEDCAELIRRVSAHGYTKLALIPMGDVETAVRRLATTVLRRL